MMNQLRSKKIIWLLMIFEVIQICWSKIDWSQCNQYISGCNCKFVEGKKQANCVDADLNNIPEQLSDDIQVLVLDNNNIRVLKKEIFRNVGLINLQKLSLKNCKIQDVDKFAFYGLSILITIDLSNNEIKRLDPMTFRETEKLRILYLNNNLLQRLEDNLFSNLEHLQTVEINYNHIYHIGHKTFTNLKTLNLKLKGNQLTQIEPTVFENVRTVSYLDIQNNPWRCDCNLREFFIWSQNVSITTPVVCNEPDYLKDQHWNQLIPDSFACKPDILFPNQSDSSVEPTSDELMLSCKVTGNPKPEARWTFNSRILNNNTVAGITVYESEYTNFESGSSSLWCNITITKPSQQNEGVYTCAARNSAGVVERNVSVSLHPKTGWFNVTGSSFDDGWILLTCLIIGITCGIFLLILLGYLCYCRGEKTVTKKPPNNSITTNGDITHHIIAEPEQQKTLLTAVNPVQKPPRKYDSSPQSENGGTELTEVNRNLLDDNSVQAGTSLTGDSIEDRHSTNSLEQLSSCNSQDNLLLQDHPRFINRSHHPPDLLAFSSRRLQTSPVNSSISNDLDNSRFRHLHSPVRSPIYQMHTYSPSYETLSYSRTHSPFSPISITPVISQRQGYVTIPRRPRIPSWSSAPTPTVEEALSKTEPVYDNLGPRTTADGSSVLSLTKKILAESPAGNFQTRPLPPAPLYTSHTLPHKSKLNHVFLSIRENEEPHFRPRIENGGVIRPLPLQQSPLPKDATSTPNKKRTSWAFKQTPETGILKKPLGEKSPSPKLGTGTIIKSKVPPKPPPKPKKSGPLFEDEGEDGTEV